MSKIKRNFVSQQGDFDWTPYEDGWNGKTLKVNSAFLKKDKSVKVYCHESYAEELYEKYFGTKPVMKDKTFVAKDMIEGSIMKVVDIRPTGDDKSVIVDTLGGGSCRIDLTKEKEYINILGVSTPSAFVESIKIPENRKMFLETSPVVKIVENGRASLWSGYTGTAENEFEQQLKNPTAAYMAEILETNNGGYIVNVGGVKCFMPGSMAAAGIITDFQSLIGKKLPVMIVNKVVGKGFVVSYKRYLAAIMPKKVTEELSLNMSVFCKVTGCSKNGVFVQFDDKDGEPTFSGLIYRDNMSSFLEEEFDEGRVLVGDKMRAYIHSIDINGDKVRIVLGDMDMSSTEYAEKKAKLSRAKQQRYQDKVSSAKEEQTDESESAK